MSFNNINKPESIGQGQNQRNGKSGIYTQDFLCKPYTCVWPCCNPTPSLVCLFHTDSKLRHRCIAPFTRRTGGQSSSYSLEFWKVSPENLILVITNCSAEIMEDTIQLSKVKIGMPNENQKWISQIIANARGDITDYVVQGVFFFGLFCFGQVPEHLGFKMFSSEHYKTWNFTKCQLCIDK